MLSDLDSPRAELLQKVVICMKASEAKILEPIYSSKGPKSTFFGSRISENIFFAKKKICIISFDILHPKKFLWQKW